MSDYFKNTFEYVVSIFQFFEYFFYFLIGLTIYIVSKLMVKITKVLTIFPKKITDIKFHKSIFLKILKFNHVDLPLPELLSADQVHIGHVKLHE
mgnify:CR=1 FL=1